MINTTLRQRNSSGFCYSPKKHDSMSQCCHKHVLNKTNTNNPSDLWWWSLSQGYHRRLGLIMTLRSQVLHEEKVLRLKHKCICRSSNGSKLRALNLHITDRNSRKQRKCQSQVRRTQCFLKQHNELPATSEQVKKNLAVFKTANCILNTMYCIVHSI